MDIKKRLYLVLMLIIVVITAGSTGYYLLFKGQYKWIDCVYMTVVSLTTVGYGEVIPIEGNISAQIYTMVLITFGMGIIVYGISTLTAILIEGELTGILRKNKMLKQIKRLKDHYIVCGGGETGRPILGELAKNKEAVVLIEMDQDNIDRCQTIENLLYIKGDATDDENLMAAGITQAAGLAIALPSDKDNLYITMTARILNKDIRIISRMIDEKLRPKLKMAGANRVVSPNTIGALRIASELIRPAAVDFLDSMLRSQRSNLRIHEIVVTENSGMVDKSLSASRIGETYNLLVLGARYRDNEIEFNPSPSQILKAGMTLIVMGEIDQITKARKEL